MTDSQKLGDIFKQAADVAQQVPDALREIAFQRALDALLGGPQATSEMPATGRSGASQEQSAPVAPQRDRATHSASVTKLLEVLDRTEMAALIRGRKVLDRSLLLLRAAQHHDIDALTAADIAEVLAKKFRETTTASAIRMALDRSPSYTDRRPNGGTFLYSLMAPGEVYLESLASTPALSAAPARVTRVRKRVSKHAIAKPEPRAGSSAGTKSVARPKRALTSGRPGPKTALESLVAEGFFSSPRTMSDILSHLQVEKTYAYKTSDMTATLQRMVRQGSLTRSRNAEAQFQYKAK